ncbi:MAG: RNA-binding protein [Nanohaloarchaea archaeon]|nr:RNA-binding protein [Candidatus Nanohaloarchaea archaeon]
MKREQLSKKNLKELTLWLESSSLVCTFSKKDKVERLDNKVLAVNGNIDYVIFGDKIYPSLKLVLKEGVDKFKKISVDAGAIRFVTKGADVMRPGVTKIDDGISKGDFIIIVDDRFLKPLACGISGYDSAGMRALDKGKVLKNIHFVGDDVWEGKY